MLTREQIRTIAMQNKDDQGLTWPDVGKAISRSPVYAASLVYGYAQATAQEAEQLVKVLSLPDDAKKVLTKVPNRSATLPWPPSDPCLYRLYEAIMLYSPAFKDVAHEIFGDGIMSAIDMTVDIHKIEDPAGVPRMVLTLNGKWLQYKKY